MTNHSNELLKILDYERQVLFRLAGTNNLLTALRLCLEAAIKISGASAGGVYLLDRNLEMLGVKTHIGLSREFVEIASGFQVESKFVQTTLRGLPLHMRYSEVLEKYSLSKNFFKFCERINAISVIPFKSQNKVIGCFFLQFFKVGEMLPIQLREVEDWAMHVGESITRISDENKLIKKQQQLSNLFDSLHDFVFIISTEGQILYINKAVNKVLGYQSEELISQSVLMLHPPNRKQDAVKILHTIMLNGKKTIECVIPLVKKDGSCVPVITKTSKIIWEGDEAIVGISRDVSTEKEIEETRRKNLDFLALLVNLTTNFIKDPLDEIDFLINEILAKVGQFDLTDRSYIFLFTDHDHMSNTHEWCATGVEPQIDFLQNLLISSFPWWMKKLNNHETIWIDDVEKLPEEANTTKEVLQQQSIISLLVEPLIIDNEVIGFLGLDSVKKKREFSGESRYLVRLAADLIANVIVRKKQENSLLKTASRIKDIIKSIPDPLFILDNTGLIVETYGERNGQLFKSILSENLYAGQQFCFLDAEKCAKFNSLLNQVVAGTGTLTMEVQHLAQSENESWFELRLTKMGDDRVICLVRDISARKKIEYDRLDFLNLVAHELRSPIATMYLMTELIDLDSEDPEQNMQWQTLKSELSHQKFFVENILSSNRLASGIYIYDFHSFTIQEAQTRISEHLLDYVSHRRLSFTITSNLPEEQVLVNLDPLAINLAIKNLVNNAEKYSRSTPIVELRFELQEGHFLIQVADRGMGISEADLRKLFNRWFTTACEVDYVKSGHGLGLFIVKSIVERHKGKISVNSKVGQGTVFEISLPVKN
jgi:PAS domain S-box-containing protein